MNTEELNKILAGHATWRAGSLGSRADLRDANLRGANLQYADLWCADLLGANLLGANLRGANLQYANLRGANLRGANLQYANLWGADLQDVDLLGANLRGANLRGADLQDANLQDANLLDAKLQGESATLVASRLSIVPATGLFHGWKKCLNERLVKLEIPAESKRSNATGRKCRAEFVRVLEVVGGNGAVSIHDPRVVYRVGEVVRCDHWCDDRWQECAGGIHFYLTREEAEAHR